MSSNSSTRHSASLQNGALNVSYLKIGSGPNNLILLPGALGSAKTDFGPQLEKLNAGDEFTLIAWDPPGYGESRPPKRTFPLDFFDRDAKVADELMTKELGFDKYNVLGWSDGGITGLVMAAIFPNNVEKLVIWGANSYISSKDVADVENVRDVSKWSERMRKPMEDVYGVDYFPVLWGQWCDSYKAIYEQRDGDIVDKRLKDIKCPVLIIHGDKDAMVDGVHPDNMHAKIAGSKLHRFPEGKHNLHLKYQDEFNNMVKDFFLKN